MGEVTDDNGRPKLVKGGMTGVPRKSVAEQIRQNRAETSVEIQQRQLDTVDLIVQGASLRAIAERNGTTLDRVRDDYFAGMAYLADRSIDRTLALREEVTERQRMLILSNIARAKAGDSKSAAIVQRADEMLISMYGLRSIKVEMPERPRDPVIAEAMEAYLAGVSDRIRK